MVSVCLPSDALLQHLLSYLGVSYLGRGVSLHGCSSNVQPLLLTLDEGYLLTAASPEVAQLFPTLCNPMDCSLQSSSVHGCFQAIVLEWIAICFSRGSSRPKDQTWVCLQTHIVDKRFTTWATREVTCRVIDYIIMIF